VNHPHLPVCEPGKTEGSLVVDDPQSIIRCGNKVYLFELARRLSRDSAHGWWSARRRLKDRPRSRAAVRAEATRQRVLRRRVPRRHASRTWRGLAAPVVRARPRRRAIVHAHGVRLARGLFDRQPLFACRYYMADGHWQIYHHGEQRTKEGDRRGSPCNTLRARSLDSP